MVENMSHREVIEIIAKYIGHIIAVASLVHLYLIYYSKRHEFFTDLRGKDLRWQLLEISAIGWYILFPMLVVVSLFGLNVTTEVWASMDFVYAMNLGLKKYEQYLGHKFNKPTTDEVK
jgi:hypothetical protein